MTYSLAELHKYREQKQRAVVEPEPEPQLDAVPPDAPIDDPDAVLHVWARGRWVPYEKWLATAPVQVQAEAPRYPVAGDVIAGICERARVWIVRDGERWLLYASAKRGRGKQKMATPFLEHAIRTAEEWYGAPIEGWRTEGQGNEVQP